MKHLHKLRQRHSVFHRVLFRLETGAKGFLEGGDCLGCALIGRLRLLSRLLGTLLLRFPRPVASGDYASRRTPGRTAARIVVGNFTDDGTGRGAPHRAFSPGSLGGLLSLLLLLGRRLFLLFGLLGGLERVAAGVRHGPVVALGLVDRLLLRFLAGARESVDIQGSRKCFLSVGALTGGVSASTLENAAAAAMKARAVGIRMACVLWNYSVGARAYGVGVQAAKTLTVMPSSTTAIEASPVSSTITMLKARAFSVPG